MAKLLVAFVAAAAVVSTTGCGDTKTVATPNMPASRTDEQPGKTKGKTMSVTDDIPPPPKPQ